MDAGKLFLVATPIGNLRDITLRALDTLRTADLVACEDTRVTRKLLAHYEIHVPLMSFHDHSGEAALRHVIGMIQQAKNVAYVTDGGTPAVSDPGFSLVREAIREGIRVEVMPGPSAFLAALVGSGIPCERFAFEGYLPHKPSARRKHLEAVRREGRTLVFYESPHRASKALRDMAEILGDRPACVAREITKTFEEYLRGGLEGLGREVASRKKLGEMVIVVQGLRTSAGGGEESS